MIPLLLALSAQAFTLDVCAVGCPYNTIQGAVNAAATGDTVHVQAGLYAENVVVANTISIVGDGAGLTIVDGGHAGNVMYVIGGTVTLDGLTFRNASVAGGLPGGAAVHANQGNVVIRRCEMTGSTTGFALWNFVGATLENNLIHHNMFWGLQLDWGPSTVVFNTIAYNGAGGVTSNWGGGALVRFDNNILAYHPSVGSNVRGEETWTQNFNLVWENAAGVGALNPDADWQENVGQSPYPVAPAGFGNLKADPMLDMGLCGGLELLAGSPAIDAGDPGLTDPDGTRADIGAYGGPGAPATMVQDDGICVSPGVSSPYRPGSPLVLDLAVQNTGSAPRAVLLSVWAQGPSARRTFVNNYRLQVPPGPALTRSWTGPVVPVMPFPQLLICMSARDAVTGAPLQETCELLWR